MIWSFFFILITSLCVSQKVNGHAQCTQKRMKGITSLIFTLKEPLFNRRVMTSPVSFWTMYGDTVLGSSGASLTALWNAFPRLVSTSRHVLVIVSSRFSYTQRHTCMHYKGRITLWCMCVRASYMKWREIPTWCTNIFIILNNSTCFGAFLRPSSGVYRLCNAAYGVQC